MVCPHQRDPGTCPLCSATRTQAGSPADAEVSGDGDTFVRAQQVTQPTLEPGAKIGRYVLLDVLGAGGMGMIYVAYDPRLDRRVAIKVLRTGKKSGSAHTDGQARLLREAQAMAQLSHPNVVPVYDVGPFEESVYVAMELVKGETLSQWTHKKRRSWREILDVFLAAGRGLEAAHAAGLVHRDFKPANVLVGEDGRPRVTDFGLARSLRDTSSSSGSGPKPVDPEPESISEVTPSLNQPLTMKGAVMGSPGYMAPEQYAGAETSPATDQFAFCVALYEAFYGLRPFLGKTLEELSKATNKGEVPPPPKGSTVPPWLHKILAKGLSKDPAQRHASMTELLKALSHDPARTRRQVAAAAAAVLVLSGAVAGTAWFTRQQARACRGMEQRLFGVWDAQVSAKAEQAFKATGKSYAPLAFNRAKEVLDRYASQWAAARTDACEATLVRHEQNERQMALRTGCLDRRLEELRTLAGAFANADSTLVDQALEAANRLSPLESCAHFRAGQETQLSPEVRQAADALAQELDRARALSAAAKFASAREKLKPALEQARRLKLHALEAEGEQVLGELELADNQYVEAKNAFERGARAAEAIGDDELTARCLAPLISVLGWRLEHPEAGITLANVAAGVIERLGGNERLEGQVEEGLGDSEWQAGHRAESLKHYRAARDHYLKALPADSPDIARIHSSIGWVLFEQGEFVEARAELEQSRAIRTATLGAGHPSLSSSWNELGSLAKQQGDYDEAVRCSKEGLAIDDATLEPDNPATLTMLSNVAQDLAAAGRGAEAGPYLERAERVLAANPGLPPSRRTNLKWTRALVEIHQRHFADGARLCREALAEAEVAHGKDHPETGWIAESLGEALAGLKQYPEALASYERFLAVEEKLGATLDTDYAKGLVKSAQVLQALGRSRDGLERLERAVRLLDSPKVYPPAAAGAKLALAEALWAPGGDRPRARALALEAQGIYAKHRRSKEAAEAERWLQAHAR